jgi:hypothetical protein
VTLVVLLILAAIWALYLASWLRSRARIRSANTISSFNRHLSVLERARPVGVAAPSLHAVGATPLIRSSVPRPHDPLVRPPQVRGLLSGPPITVHDARRRRRTVLLLLVVVAALSTVPYLLLGSAFAYLAVVGCTLLASYVFLLVRAQKLVDERREKVRYLYAADFEYEYDEYDYEYEPAFATVT